uniref:Uncharacterized protein n=1 Tax=Anopheles farauti TaxID=69004 RepID=A0A182QBY7_9DIPT
MPPPARDSISKSETRWLRNRFMFHRRFKSCGIENKDDILSCAQLEARQQLLSEQAEKCTEIGNSSVECSSDQLSVEQCPAATLLPPVVAAITSAEPEKLKPEETLSIPVGANIVQVPCVKQQLPVSSNEEAQNNRPVPVASGVGKVLLYVKNDTSTIEEAASALPAQQQQQRNRILRELNSIPAVPKPSPPPSAAISRPVSVTASIFTSLPTGTSSGSGSEKVRKQQQPAATSPQSVTAKLFVSLPPASGGVSAAGCNGGVSSGASGAGSKPQHATEKIFAPRTEDMNKGFLMFSEEEPGLTMLKDEPDDLTHLAPTAGDACIPLEESGTFFNEMFEDFFTPHSYTLLQDELCSLDSQDTRLDTSSIVVPSGTIGIPVSATDSLTNGLTVASVTSSPLASGCTTSGTDEDSSLAGAANSGNQTHHQPNLTSTSNASVSSPSSSISVSPSPVPSSPSRSHVSSNPNSPSGTSGLGSSASSTVSTVDGHHHVSIGGGNTSQHNASSNDPFINYRDEVNEVSPSPHLLSPGISKSPESSSLPSLCSPNGSLPEDELAFMSLNMDELDLSMRAPYISMSEVDDLPLLTSDDLLWGVPAATIEGGGPGTPISAFGLSGKFFIKDEFSTLGSTSSHGTESSALVEQQSTASPAETTAIDATNNSSNNRNGTIEIAVNNGNNDSKSALTNSSPPADSSLAALLCGGNVISIQSETSNLSQPQPPINNQILMALTNASLNTANQLQQQQRHNNQQQSQQQHLQQPQIQNTAQHRQQETVSNVKRIKLSEQNPLQHSMVVLPTSVKLSEAWKFEDLLQLNANASTSGNNAKSTIQQTPIPQTNIIASFVTTPTPKKATASGVNGNNKRTLNGAACESTDDTGIASKRLKSSTASTVSSPSSAPQLLQQLMAPSPVPQKLKSKSRSSQDATGGGRWPNGQAGGVGGLLQEQSGNSVLMNLLVSGCDNTMPLTPPEVLIGDTAIEAPNEISFNLGDEDDDGNGVLFSSINPLIGGQGLLNEAIARPLTNQTESMSSAATDATVRGQAIRSEKQFGAPEATTQLANDFSMIVSPSLLTPTDMEIWRAIQQGQLDPKKIASPSASYYGSGGNIPKSLSGTPTAQLSADLLGDPSDASILAAFDADGESDGAFRTISATDGVGLHQGLLI